MLRRALGIARSLWDFVRPHWPLATVSVVLSVGAAAVEAGAMGVFALVARLLTGSSLGTATADLGEVGAGVAELLGPLEEGALALVLIGGLAGLQLTRSAMQFAAKVAAIRVQTEIEGGARRAIFDQFMGLSFSQLKGYKTGEMTSLIEHVMYLGLVVSRLNTILSQAVLMLAYLVVLAWLSLPMTLIVAVAGVAVSGSLIRVVRRIRRQGGRFTRASVSLSEQTLEFLHGIRLVQTYGREDFARRRVSRIIGRSQEAQKRGLMLQALISPSMDSITILGIAAILVLGIWQMGGIEGEGLAQLLTFLFVLYRFLPRIRVINDRGGQILGYLPFVERITAILDTEGKEFIHPGGNRKAVLRRQIEFRGVSYKYPGAERDAVSDLNFEIDRGSTVALVGPSGGGKSTVADLLIGLVQPTAGEILVDGVSLLEIDWATWRKTLGVVSQDTFVFSASAAENIAFGDLEAGPEEIERAARAAGAHRFIVEMEQGYDTMVGNQGTRLSGGQRQRLGIARALVREPQILILDEATSNLDSQAEHEIQSSLRLVSRDRTTVAIAHRLSTIAYADHILVVDSGTIVERGRHEDLMTEGGLYSALWALQVSPGSI